MTTCAHALIVTASSFRAQPSRPEHDCSIHTSFCNAGGPTGVEFAGDLCDFLNKDLITYGKTLRHLVCKYTFADGSCCPLPSVDQTMSYNIAHDGAEDAWGCGESGHVSVACFDQSPHIRSGCFSSAWWHDIHSYAGLFCRVMT